MGRPRGVSMMLYGMSGIEAARILGGTAGGNQADAGGEGAFCSIRQSWIGPRNPGASPATGPATPQTRAAITSEAFIPTPANDLTRASAQQIPATTTGSQQKPRCSRTAPRLRVRRLNSPQLNKR